MHVYIYVYMFQKYEKNTLNKFRRGLNPLIIYVHPPPPTIKHTFQDKLLYQTSKSCNVLCITIVPLHAQKINLISSFSSIKMHFLIKSLKSELFQFEKSDQNSENVLHICMCISSMCNNINLKHQIV